MSLYDQAIEELTLATETDHSIWRATAYFELGRLYQELGRLEEAIDAYEMAVASSSSNVTYRLGLANAYVAADRLEDALRELEAALSLQPDNPSAKADYEHLRQKMEK
jgi:tetratricopeptide (TPR) repeat protein